MSHRSATDHYDAHLARFYVWSVGGRAAALARGRGELDALELGPPGRALDLGAGPGTHTIPLLERGWEVVAVDTTGSLLDELRAAAGDHEGLETRQTPMTRALEDESSHELILCMGDTLTHLESEQEAASLVDRAARRLAPAGRLVLGFRDYSSGEPGSRAFIPVRSDESRIHTCVLETGQTRVTVHDLLHERSGPGWRLTVSSYDKLRLDPEVVAHQLEDAGLAVDRPDTGGMVTLVGTRPSLT